MISLGGIALPDGTGNTGRIAWTDRDAYASAAGRTVRTLGGNLHYAEATLPTGRPITLEALEGQCWLTQTQKDALIALANGLGIVTFVYDDIETYSCIFDRENGAIAFERKRPTSDEFWYGVIRLLTTSTS